MSAANKRIQRIGISVPPIDLFHPMQLSPGLKRAIVKRLDDWHHRSGDNIDFFCVGYVTWSEFDDDKPVGELRERYGPGKRQLYYSSRAFEDIRKNVAKLSGWKSSGEADLLLVNAVQDEHTSPTQSHPRSSLALDEIIALDIDKIVREGVYASASRMMERICQVADAAAESGDAINVTDFSDREFARTLFRRSLGAVVKKLKLDAPLGSRHFIVGAHLLEA